MATTPYISEIRIFAFNYPPDGWLQCNGQFLPISQFSVLFALIGNSYGGDGKTTFAVPNLMGRVPMHQSDSMQLASNGGEASHTLTEPEIPEHDHPAFASSNPPDVNTPAGNFWASKTGASPYGSKTDVNMSAQALATGGNDQPHNNMAPYLVLNICMAVTGQYPFGL